ELDGEEVSCAHVDRPTLDAGGISTTRQYLVAPEVEPRLVGFATEEVDVMLPDKIIGRVNRVAARDSIARGRENCVRLIREQRERIAFRTKVIIHQRRRDGVEVVRVHIVETVTAVAVGDYLCGFGAAQVHGQTRER